MSRTKREFKGKEYNDKSKKKKKDKKHFGFTSGTHSKFEETKEHWEERAENENDEIAKRRTEKLKDKKYPVKGEDYIKYGYGNGSKKKIKNYKKDGEDDISHTDR